METTDYCTRCDLPFYVVEHKMGVPGGKEKEPIDCPYCSITVRESMTDGWFRTSKMTESEIEAYKRKKN